jgi:hypothetical protein
MLIRRWRSLALASAPLAALGATAALAAPAGTSHGPSTVTDPYVIPVAEGVATKSLFTVSDGQTAGNGYPMVGIPDGLGAYGNEDSRDFTLFMNQELTPAVGVVRRHGQQGAFVTQLDIDSDTYQVETGRDLIDPGVRYWDYPSQTYGSSPSTGSTNPRDATDTFLAQLAAFGRFCSASLTPPGALESGSRGYNGQIYFANEETGNEGRVFGVTADGQAQQLPHLGMASWENNNAPQTGSATTVVIGDEDAADGQLHVYVGSKQKTGNPFDKAGLTNGRSYVVDLADEAVSNDAGFRAAYGKDNPQPFTLGAAEEVNWDHSGARQATDGAANGLSLNRIEDGVFDPKSRDDYYFVTTEGGPPSTDPDDPSVARDGGGLWHLHFNDVAHPELGGTLELLLDGSEAPYLSKPDNVTIDRKGNLLIQEDPGNSPHVARIVAYDTDTGDRGVVATFDPDQFKPGAPAFITQDEESSGIIDARKFLGHGWFLFDAQVHKANPEPDKVEYGQLLAMNVRNFRDVYDIDG